MHLRSLYLSSICFALVSARFENVVVRQDSYSSGSSPTNTIGPSSTASASSSSPVVTGDSKCSKSMCVNATVNGSLVEYALQSTGSSKVGWMAVGFGSRMANTPMVIMWPNSDGSVTLSQRKAPGEVMPTVDPNPPRVASFQQSLSSSTTDAMPKFVFTVPANSDGSQSVIWAMGKTNPGSSSVNAALQQHSDFGSFTLDLTKTNATSGSGSGGTPSSSGSNGPLTHNERLIAAHGILLTLGFLLFLPAGALLARWTRTFSSRWFTGHWRIQFLLAGPFIIIGFALVVRALVETGGPHFEGSHEKLGLALVILYFFQLITGALIHFVKSKTRRSRPPQNYAHAFLGILIIALAFYQVRTGFRHDWVVVTGRHVAKGADIVWYIWVVTVPLAYFGGLALLRKQYRQESLAKQHIKMSDFEHK